MRQLLNQYRVVLKLYSIILNISSPEGLCIELILKPIADNKRITCCKNYYVINFSSSISTQIGKKEFEMSFKIIFVGSIFLITSFMARADDRAVCPNIEELKNYKLEISFPYSYDQNHKEMKFYLLAQPVGKNKNLTALTVYPVSAGEDPSATLSSIIDKLQIETPIPQKFRLLNKTLSSICAYSNSENKKMNVLVYFNDFTLNSANKLSTQTFINQLPLLG